MNDQSHSMQDATSGAEGVFTSADKGKGKAIDLPPQDVSMDEDDESSEDEVDEAADGEEEEDEDEDDLQEIEADNILAPSRRTDGKHVDYAKAAQEDGIEEDDEDDDEDFEPEDEEMQG